MSKDQKFAAARNHDPANQRVCPVCGKEAASKYFNEKIQKWVYAHRKRFETAVYHEALK